jgi:KipI family sensor histidine kinase inhibitor
MDGVEIRPVGSSALLLEVDDPLAWFAALSDRRDAGELAVVEIVPGAGTVLLDGVADPTGVAAAVRSWPAPTLRRGSSAGTVRIPVAYGGSDLASVASHWGVSEEAAVRRLASTEFTVAFCGFSPGFAYLTGLPAEWAVPRLASPRAKVPAGSVALAGVYAGIYPTASPGGWQLVGRTETRLFDVDSATPALLSPGTRVWLEDAAWT